MNNVNHPKHYNNHPSGIECIKITRHMNFNLGNAFKYVFRRNDKGTVEENLSKAMWYVNDELARIQNNKIEYISCYQVFELVSKVAFHEPDRVGAILIKLVSVSWAFSNKCDLEIILKYLEEELEDASK